MNYVLPLHFALVDKDDNPIKSTDEPHYSIGGNRNLTKQLREVIVIAYK